MSRFIFNQIVKGSVLLNLADLQVEKDRGEQEKLKDLVFSFLHFRASEKFSEPA